MSKFVFVKQPPEVLAPGEYVVFQPSFLENVKACESKRPKNGTITVNYLREVVAQIGYKYAGEDFNALTDINISRYIGTPFTSDEDMDKLVLDLLDKQCPKILDRHVTEQLKRRPTGVDLIYFCGNHRQATALLDLGFENITSKEFEKLKSNKPKKVVGKPAITDEDATFLRESNV